MPEIIHSKSETRKGFKILPDILCDSANNFILPKNISGSGTLKTYISKILLQEPLYKDILHNCKHLPRHKD